MHKEGAAFRSLMNCFAMAVSIGHIAEVGGKAPAAFCGDATEIFQEGLRIPPIKIKKRGQDVEEVWKIMLANVRTPRFNYGDLRALIASVDLGEQRFLELVHKYGMPTIQGAGKELLDYSERLMRAEIAAIPDGVYTFQDYLEDDGIEDRAYTIKVTCHVQGVRQRARGVGESGSRTPQRTTPCCT